MSDIDTGVVDSLKALDPERPIREAEVDLRSSYVAFVPILLQKSLMVPANSDSVAVLRFAMGQFHDGSAQSEPESVVLFVLP